MHRLSRNLMEQIRVGVAVEKVQRHLKNAAVNGKAVAEETPAKGDS